MLLSTLAVLAEAATATVAVMCSESVWWRCHRRLVADVAVLGRGVPVRPDELDTLMPAAVAMFTEEVGVSPLRLDGGAGYRARVADLIRSGQSLAWIQDGEVVFKAEIGAVSRAVCQVQGVWVAPGRRGRGIGAAGTAAVVEYARRAVAPVVSLYVNDFNTPARAAYQRVGFREVGRYSSVLF